MLHTKPFIRRILLLGVLPTCIAIFLLLVGFAQAQSRQTAMVQKAITSVIENSLLAPAVQYEDNPELLRQAATALLYIDPITHIALLDRDAKVVENFGLPFGLGAVSLEPGVRTMSEHDQTSYLALPLQGGTGGWIVSGVRTNIFALTRYRGYLLLLFVASCAIMTTTFFANKLYNHITRPLKNILVEIRQALSSDSQSSISAPKNYLYSDFVDILNEMLSMQRCVRDEMQGFVDQATKELRETLETVEIQNIELDIARKNALQASRAKSEFLANTSHELRTPLNGILGFTTLLLKTGLSNQQNDYLSTIEQSAQGLLTVISDILDFSKLETGQLTLEYKPIFVRELVEEIFGIYAPQAHEKNIRLLSIINHNVPRNLLGDPQRLKQVINNLISNAIKFSTRGNVVVRATALGEVDNQLEIKFSITDSGIGLSEEQQENLFNAFTKLDSSDSRIGGGTGLGLAIAKGLVDRMKGEIGVDSSLHNGSVFWFKIRLGIDRQRVSQSPLMNSLYDLRAMVFDTNSVSRLETTHLLAGWGVHVVEEGTFTNISHTLAHETGGIDVAILDACHEENNFDKAKILTSVQNITSQFKIPSIILAPPSVQRLLQDDIVGFNTALVARPTINANLHQAICSLLSITQPLPSAGAQTPPATSRTTARSNIKVLVVDDNPANRKLVCEFLRSLGASAQTAEDGYEAVAMAEEGHFDLILMDVQMPGMDGLEATKVIRTKESGRRVPIVALTAHAVNEQKTQLLVSGMDDFLSKPVSEEDLAHIIERWVKVAAGEIKPLIETPPPPAPAIVSVQANLNDQADSADVFSRAESLSLAKNKPDLAADMLVMLLDSLATVEDEVRDLVEKADRNGLAETVHKFYGGCCYCGVPALRSAAKNLEKLLGDEPQADLGEVTQELIMQIQELRLWAEEHDIDALFSDLD